MDIEHRIAVWLTGSFVAFFLAFGTYSLVQCARSNGEVDYCYISSYSSDGIQIYRLYGHRNWRQDANLAITTKFEEVSDTAKQLNCPLLKK